MTLRWTFKFYNPGTLELTYGVHDGYGGYTHRKFSWTGKQTETRAVAENSAAGTAVGDPVTGTPYDDGDDETDDALTYTPDGRGGDLRGVSSSIPPPARSASRKTPTWTTRRRAPTRQR